MIWRNPLAWLGLATVLVPIAIHLLVRQQAQPLAFPSLRFLQASRLAAVKRRRLSDWLLLALRLLILAAAVAALADPFLATASRRATWAARTSRFVIVDTPAGASADAGASAGVRANADARTRANARVDASANGSVIAEAAAQAAGDAGGRAATTNGPASDSARGAMLDSSLVGLDPALGAAVRAETASAFASSVYATTELQSGVTQALAWLAAAPPAAREIVIVSPLTRGRVTEAIGAQLPAHVGLRFTRVGGTEEQRRIDGRPATVRGGAPLASSGSARAGTDARVNEKDAFDTRTPDVTVHVDRTDVRWRAHAAGAAPAAVTGATPPQAAAAIDVATEPGAFAVRALGLRVEAAPRDLPAARAALDAVLTEGVPVGGQSSRPIIVAIDAAPAAPRPANPGANDDAPARALTAPWMAEALDAIANDAQLRESLSSLESASARGVARLREASSNGASTLAGATASSSPRETVRLPEADGVTPITLLRDADGTPIVSAWATSVAADSAAVPATRPSPPDASALPPANARARDNNRMALLLVSGAPADSDVTALLIRAALRAAADADPLPRAEIARIPDAELAAWQRPAALPPLSELTRVEAHDRRWFWGAALALLLAERIVRTRMRRREPERPEVAHAA